MITRYDDVSISNNLLSSQLEETKQATQLTLDALKATRSDLSTLVKFKQQLVNQKLKNRVLFKIIDSLDQVNNELVAEKQLISNALNSQKIENATLYQFNYKTSHIIYFF